ncbi:MAG: exopolysaccharide biosynthesis polyprenyl glycosylphosphotransferase [Parasphingorhabdus sp.]|jgi:exopolysaccharide biosynthesis polyprenyl glycosylphosphotransferase
MNIRGNWTSIILLTLDVGGLYLIIILSQAARLNEWGRDINFSLAMVLFVTLMVFYVFNLYSLDRMSRSLETLMRTSLAVGVASLITAAMIYTTRSFDVDPVLWRSVFLVSMFSYLFWAALIRFLIIRWVRINRRPRWLVVAKKATFDVLYQEMASVDPAILLHDLKGDHPDQIFLQATELDKQYGLDGVIVDQENYLNKELIPKLMHLRFSGCRVLGTEEFFEEFAMKIPVAYLKDHWFVISEGFTLLHHSAQLRVKRLFDLLIAGLGLIVLVPAVLLCAPLIKLDGGRVFYRQQRTGKDGIPFFLVKLRTMREDAEQGKAQWAEKNDPRTTTVGRWLRRTRLDELPQLWNVIKGDMSFVGPRPERPDFNLILEKEIPYYNLRHMVKPGITGWAQVMYPYGASVSDALRKLEYDLYYIKNYSLILDLYIALRTIKVVVSHAGR